ncbi:MAG: flagellar M-ring protein FliF [Burkholderiales bacterium]|nr:flagellar M-ring protein FliF [Burkholderiales bacterium]
MADNALALPRPAATGSDLIAGFRALPTRSKIAGMVATAAAVAVLAAAWMWSQAPDFKVLFAGLDGKDGGAVIAALNQQGVPYRLAEGGAILVPASQVLETRLKLASAGLPKSGNPGFEIVDNQKFGATQFQEQVNFQRAMEGELTRTIQSLAAVQSARVHLAIPKPSVFLREQQQPTASVVVSLYPGRTLERAQIAGIMHLVASSVPNLTARNVAVVDQKGSLLSPQANAGAGGRLDPEQMSHVAQIEQKYIKQIIDILAPLYGENNVRAQVAADIDFSQTESTSENFKPNQSKDESVVRSSQVSESVNGGPGAGGVPGALTNQPPGPASAPIAGAPAAAGGAGGPAASNSRREAVTNYEVDKTVRHVRSAAGTVKRITAAIVVNHRKAPGARPGAPPAMVPLSAEEIGRIEGLVREAIGFAKERGDSVNVVNAPFTPPEVEVLPEVPLWKQPDTLAMAKEIGKHGLLAALLLYVLFGLVRPLVRHALEHRPPPPPPPPAADAEPAEPTVEEVASQKSLTQIRELARQDPKMVAAVVRNWVNGNE